MARKRPSRVARLTAKIADLKEYVETQEDVIQEHEDMLTGRIAECEKKQREFDSKFRAVERNASIGCSWAVGSIIGGVITIAIPLVVIGTNMAFPFGH